MVSGATGQDYIVHPGDSAKYLFFEVTLVAATGTSPGSAAVSAGTLVSDPPPGGSNILIEENFGGGPLNGKFAEMFAAAIKVAGIECLGSRLWIP